MITIEWANSLKRDGSRKKPPASTIHGWLAKWRGTFLGDERLRSMGMREMREARATRRYRQAKKQQVSAVSSGKSIFSFFTVQREKPVRIIRHSKSPRTSGRGDGGTVGAKQVVRAKHAQRPAKATGHRTSRVNHKLNLRAPTSRPQKTTRKHGH